MIFKKLKKDCENCTKCDLSKTRTNVVFGSGNKHAKILIIGEAPGNKEDLQGLPFVGTAGKNLNKYLEQVGLSREEIYIANILKCRPPENRNPSVDELKICTPWLFKQIKLIEPKIICTLGNFATKYILSGCDNKKMKNMEGISKLHGKEKRIKLYNEDKLIFPLYHPAALIYNRKLEPTMNNDLKKLKKIIEI